MEPAEGGTGPELIATDVAVASRRAALGRDLRVVITSGLGGVGRPTGTCTSQKNYFWEDLKNSFSKFAHTEPKNKKV